MTKRMAGESRSLIKQCVELAWYMRGSIQYQTLLDMTPAERELVGDFVREHMDSIKKHSFPVY